MSLMLPRVIAKLPVKGLNTLFGRMCAIIVQDVGGVKPQLSFFMNVRKCNGEEMHKYQPFLAISSHI